MQHCCNTRNDQCMFQNVLVYIYQLITDTTKPENRHLVCMGIYEKHGITEKKKKESYKMGQLINRTTGYHAIMRYVQKLRQNSYYNFTCR